MAKQVITVPASKTPQTVTIETNDPVITIAGTTPLDPVIPPPVVDPPPVVTPPTGYTTIYSNGYDKDSDLDHVHGQLGKGTISTTVTKNSAGSFKSVVNVGDQPISQGFRSENQYDSALTVPEGAVEFDILFEKWESPNWGASVGCQWHPGNNDNGGSALLFMEGAQQKWNVYFWGRGYMDSYDNPAPINANQWYHLRFETKWSKTNGYIRIYIDGKLYWSFVGQTLISSDIPYIKSGQNNYSNNAKVAPHGITLYIDNLVVSKKN